VFKSQESHAKIPLQEAAFDKSGSVPSPADKTV